MYKYWWNGKRIYSVYWFKKKLIKRGGIKYRVIKVNDRVIQAKNENAEFYNFLIFDRYSGDIQLQIWYKKKYPGAEKNDQNLKEIANYGCEKIQKLIWKNF